MKTILVLFALFALAFAGPKQCTYSTNGYYYDLRPLALYDDDGAPYSYTNENQQSYFWNFCGDLSELKNSESKDCPSASTICLKNNNGSFDIGDRETLVYSDSQDGADDGLELTYGSTTPCPTDVGSIYKTIMVLNCSQSEKFTVVEGSTDSSCFTRIVIRSKYACPYVNFREDDNGDDENFHGHHVSPIFFFLMLAGCTFCLCACCTCCIRKLRGRPCRTKCDGKGEYSSVEFQTISSDQFEKQNMQMPQMVPMHTMQNPYFVMVPPQQIHNAQQPFYAPPMYMIPQNAPVQSNGPVMTEQQLLVADEQYARQLQEQLNNE